MIVLISGLTGAGKTTYSQKLSRQLPGVVYSIDSWMKLLFGGDMPGEPTSQWFQENHQWYVERLGRCEAQIQSLVAQRAKLNQHSILDLGFATSDHRKDFINYFSKNEVLVETHFLDISLEERWQRVQGRNRERGPTFVMEVDRSLFDYMESIFEAPSAQEGVKILTLKD